MNTNDKTYAELLSWKKQRDRFSIKLTNRHGSAFLDDYMALSSKQYWDLTAIAKKYGFSRERARQIYNRLFRTPYMSIKKRKTKDKNDQTNAMNRACDPRQKVAGYTGGPVLKGAEVELLAFQKMVELGVNVEFQKNVSYDMIANGYKVDIKSCYVSAKTNSRTTKRYFHFCITKKQFDLCDFFICFTVLKGIFYIIPKTELNSRSIYIPTNYNYQHTYFPLRKYYQNRPKRYEKYKEAWHLLK